MKFQYMLQDGHFENIILHEKPDRKGQILFDSVWDDEKVRKQTVVMVV